jgi:hypothetical protein
MLTLEQMQELLDDPSIPDDQVLEIRDELYALAELIYEKWQEDRKTGKLPIKTVNGQIPDSSQGSMASGN